MQEVNLKAIADAIRGKDGSTSPIPANAFSERILSLDTGGLPQNTYTVTLHSDNEEFGMVEGSGLVSAGVNLTAIAIPAKSVKFTGWYSGEDELLSEDAEYLFAVDGNRDMTAKFIYDGRLPFGYQEVEYVETNNYGGISSGISVHTTNCRIVVDFTPLEKVAYARYVFIGQSGLDAVFFRQNKATNQMAYMSGWTQASGTSYGFGTFTYNMAKDVRITLDFNTMSKKITIGSTTVNISPVATDANISLIFGGMTDYTVDYACLAMRIHGAKVYVDDVLKGDFVPCLNTEGAPGLYNIVDGTFHGKRTGTLTAGPAVE